MNWWEFCFSNPINEPVEVIDSSFILWELTVISKYRNNKKLYSFILSPNPSSPRSLVRPCHPTPLVPFPRFRCHHNHHHHRHLHLLFLHLFILFLIVFSVFIPPLYSVFFSVLFSTSSFFLFLLWSSFYLFFFFSLVFSFAVVVVFLFFTCFFFFSFPVVF